MAMNNCSAKGSNGARGGGLHLPWAVCRSFGDRSAAMEGSAQVAGREYAAAAGFPNALANASWLTLGVRYEVAEILQKSHDRFRLFAGRSATCRCFGSGRCKFLAVCQRCAATPAQRRAEGRNTWHTWLQEWIAKGGSSQASMRPATHELIFLSSSCRVISQTIGGSQT